MVAEMDPREFLQLTAHKTLTEMAEAWSLMYNPNCRFPLYRREVIRAMKLMAAHIDETNSSSVRKDFFAPDLKKELVALKLIRVRKGFIEFSPGFLMDACLGNENFRALWQLRDDVGGTK